MPKAKLIVSEDKKTEQVWIFCPGCKQYHAFTIKSPNFAPWTWNKDSELPTFSPSLLCNANYAERRCHSFVKEGNIQFLDDCYHDLKGKTVELPDIDFANK